MSHNCMQAYKYKNLHTSKHARARANCATGNVFKIAQYTINPHMTPNFDSHNTMDIITQNLHTQSHKPREIGVAIAAPSSDYAIP